ncbi:hypothetical protein JCM8202v2_000832 [Rhodotorula sphaerocarpa]
MLPRSPSPSAPLLGRTHHHSPSPSSSHAPKAASTAAAVAVALPARRARRLALVLLGPLLLVLTLVALAAAATSSDGSRLKEIAPDWVDGVVAQRLQRLGIGSGLGSKQAAVGSEGFLAEEDGAEHELLPPPPAPRNWSREDRALRRYAWKTPPVHSSLERMLAGLTESRNQTTGGTGIGLGAADPPERIRPAPALPAHPDGQLSASQGPGLFNTGSPRKYADLVEEWRTGRPAGVCEKGEWEDAYAKLHAGMLDGSRPPRLLEFLCRAGDYCGGFADRILGMTTMFMYSVMTNRAFSISWEQPAPVDLFFDSPHIDWSRPFQRHPKSPPISPVYRDKRLLRNRTEINAHNWEPEHLDEFMPTFVDRFEDGRNTSWLQVDFNRGIVMRSFSYPSIKPHLDRLGLKASTAYSCLINYLLRPKPAALAFISQYTSFFALPENFVIGIQVRTGDLSMWTSREDAVNTVKHHSRYFTCADAVARTYAHPSQKVIYYLITDSRVLEKDALRRLGDRVVVTGLKQAHVEIKTDTSTGMRAIRRAADGFMRTIAESWIFAGTDFQIITQRSGFGKIPTWLRGRENTTIPLFNPQTDPEYTRVYRKANKGQLPPPIDCSKPEAIKSFHEMAQEWSLG